MGALVNPGGESSKDSASLPMVAFQVIINPALEKSYAKGEGGFVGIATAAGVYGDMRVSWFHTNKQATRLAAAKLPSETWESGGFS